MKKRGLIVLISAVVIALFAVVILIIAKDRLRASNMKIDEVNGTVILTDNSGTEMSVFEGRRLHDGNVLDTKEESRAVVLLDSDRFVYMLELSRARFNKSGKDMRLSLDDGSTFFYIANKLADDESLKIETTTMSIGIRGTSGYVQSDEDGQGAVTITSGNVSVYCNKTDETYDVNPGQKLSVFLQDGEWVVVIEEITSLPDEVRGIIESDSGLYEEVSAAIPDFDSIGEASDEEEDTYAVDLTGGIWYYEEANKWEPHYEFFENGTGIKYYVSKDGRSKEISPIFYHVEEECLVYSFEQGGSEYSVDFCDAGDGSVGLSEDGILITKTSHPFESRFDRTDTSYLGSDKIVGTWDSKDASAAVTFDTLVIYDDGTGIVYNKMSPDSQKPFVYYETDYGWIFYDDGAGYTYATVTTNGFETWQWGRFETHVSDDDIYNTRTGDSGDPAQASGNLDPSGIIGKWLDPDYNYIYEIKSDNTGTGPYGMSFTWSYSGGSYSFSGIEMRYVDGVLQIGDTYFNDNTMQSTTYYRKLVKQ